LKTTNKNSPFVWDHYSDQPYILKDKVYKKMMRKKHIWDFVPLVFTNMIMFPLSISLMKIFKKDNIKKSSSIEFYGMSVNLDKGEVQKELIEELGVKSLLIRLPLSDIQNIEKYKEFALSFGDDKNILINIMQDREHIDNKELLKLHIMEIFKTFKILRDKTNNTWRGYTVCNLFS